MLSSLPSLSFNWGCCITILALAIPVACMIVLERSVCEFQLDLFGQGSDPGIGKGQVKREVHGCALQEVDLNFVAYYSQSLVDASREVVSSRR